MKNVKRDSITEYGISHSRINGIALRQLEKNNREPGGHRVNLPHRDDHYMLVLIRDGKLALDVDFDHYEIDGPCLFLILPQQVHLVSPKTKLTGWSVSFDAEVLQDELKMLFDGYQNESLISFTLSEIWFKQADSLFAAVNQIIIGPSPNPSKAVAPILNGLLFVISDNNDNSRHKGSHVKNRQTSIKQQFLQLVDTYYKQQKKPSFYADKLHITTSHLNDTIKELTGRSATKLIQEHCILEARRLLHHTDLDIMEISFQIGFSNVSHFIKIFKSITGSTPKQYRLTNAPKD